MLVAFKLLVEACQHVLLHIFYKISGSSIEKVASIIRKLMKNYICEILLWLPWFGQRGGYYSRFQFAFEKLLRMFVCKFGMFVAKFQCLF